VGDWEGAACWGRLLNQNFVRMNQTSTISWSLIWSVYARSVAAPLVCGVHCRRLKVQ
jgi:hypothetical protein